MSNGEVEIPLTPKQVDIVHFRFLDVGHDWVTLKGKKLIIPGTRIDEALDILDTAVDITRDWTYEPRGRAEHIATVSLYEKVKKARGITGQRGSLTSHGELDEFEATHSLADLKLMAAAEGISTAGTKRDIARRLLKPPSVGPMDIESVPMTIPEGNYAWQVLERLPYGSALWDLVMFAPMMEEAVIFMARERAEIASQLPKTSPARWKGLGLPRISSAGNRVMPLVMMIHMPLLKTIYEVWFNFYGENPEFTQQAIEKLGKQEHLYLFFFDRGSQPVKKIAFNNEIAHFFRGQYGILKALPPWSDSEFNEVKSQLMEEYTGEDFWRMK